MGISDANAGLIIAHTAKTEIKRYDQKGFFIFSFSLHDEKLNLNGKAFSMIAPLRKQPGQIQKCETKGLFQKSQTGQTATAAF
jgi:hypothetical protein